MKKIICYAVILVLSIHAIFAGGTDDKKSAAQGPAGKLMIYTSIPREIADEISLELKGLYPDCGIEFFCASADAIRARIAREQASRKLDCDMVIAADPSYAIELKGRNMLYAYKSKEASSLAVAGDRDGYWYPVSLSNMVLVFNPANFSRRTIPETFYDFAFSDLAGGVAAMENPLESGTAMAALTALRDLYGYEYFDALGKQILKTDSTPEALAKLESGEYKVVMVPEEAVLKKREQELARLAVIFPDDGTIVIPTVIMTINDRWSANRNTKAAGIITDWFLSADGQNYIVGGWMHPARARFPKLPHDSIPTTQILERSLPINWDVYYRQRGEIRSKYEESVGKR